MDVFQSEKRDQSNITTDFNDLIRLLERREITGTGFIHEARAAGAFEAEISLALVETVLGTVADNQEV